RPLWRHRLGAASVLRHVRRAGVRPLRGRGGGHRDALGRCAGGTLAAAHAPGGRGRPVSRDPPRGRNPEGGRVVPAASFPALPGAQVARAAALGDPRRRRAAGSRAGGAVSELKESAPMPMIEMPRGATPSHGAQPLDPRRSLQGMMMTLERYWAERGCVIQQPYPSEVGAGTFNPATFLRSLGPEAWRVAYVEPSRRPKGGRYRENPNRFQSFYQSQVRPKPAP